MRDTLFRNMAAALWLVLAAGHAGSQAPERTNYFDDPFVQITSGLAGCPVPAGPLYSRDQVREEAHGRSQRGVSCHMAGRCRLPNSFLYDKEIVPRVVIATRYSGRFADTSVWASGQRRTVTLMGCVQSAAQSRDLESLIGNIDDIEGVVNYLMIGTSGTPRYEVAAPAARK
jgi:hypothetical protein